MKKKTHLAIHAPKQIVEQFPPPKSLECNARCLLWLLCLIAAIGQKSRMSRPVGTT